MKKGHTVYLLMVNFPLLFRMTKMASVKWRTKVRAAAAVEVAATAVTAKPTPPPT